MSNHFHVKLRVLPGCKMGEVLGYSEEGAVGNIFLESHFRRVIAKNGLVTAGHQAGQSPLMLASSWRVSSTENAQFSSSSPK